MTTAALVHAQGFAAMRDEWTDLLRDSAADGPFLTWEWLHAWWMHLGAGRPLRLIAVRDEGLLVGLAPLVVSRGAFPWFSQYEFLGAGAAGSDYLDVIARRGYEAAVADAIAGALGARPCALRLRNLRPGATASAIRATEAAAGWTSTETPSGECPVIPLAGHTFDSYLATLGSSHRANYRRRLRALHKNFEVRFEPVTADADRADCLDALVAFHEQRWRDRGGSSAFRAHSLRAFHHEATRRALGAGWLALYALRLDEALAAVMYGFLYNGRFYFYQHGFDDRFRDHSVGLVLMGLSIEAAIGAGASEFDMLWGTEGYKALWARESRPLTAIDLFPPDLGGAVHRRALDARVGAKRLYTFVTQGGLRAS